MLGVVRKGYTIEFTLSPPSQGGGRITQVPLDSDKRASLEGELCLLLQKEAIVRTTGREGPLFLSSFFLAPKKPDSWRPILNLRPLNAVYIRPKRFRMETLAVIIPSLRRGMWAASLDLLDAYLRVASHPRGEDRFQDWQGVSLRKENCFLTRNHSNYQRERLQSSSYLAKSSGPDGQPDQCSSPLPPAHAINSIPSSVLLQTSVARSSGLAPAVRLRSLSPPLVVREIKPVGEELLQMAVTTDASLSGWGAFCGRRTLAGVWTKEESRLHINLLELEAVVGAVRALTVLAQGRCLTSRTTLR